jgi:hypothetical protein
VLVDEFWRRTLVQTDWQAHLAEKFLSLNAQPDADMIQRAADDVAVSSSPTRITPDELSCYGLN